MVSETLYRGCHTARIFAAVNTARILEPRCTCAMACIRFGDRAWKMVSSPIYWPGNPIARGNTSPLTQLIRMIYMKPALFGQVNLSNVRDVFATQRAYAVHSCPVRIDAAPTNYLLDARTFADGDSRV